MKQSAKRFIVLLLTVISSIFSSFAQAVLLDSSFSMDGKVVTDFGSYDDRALDFAIQEDGKIIAVGWTKTGTNYDIALARYEANGDPDMTFGAHGKVITTYGDNDARARSVVIQSDGKIVIAAEGYPPASGVAIILLRYHEDGSLDETFDEDGIVSIDLQHGDSRGASIAIQKDQKLLVAGYTYNGNSADFVIARYLTNGKPDFSFGTHGIVLTSFGEENDFGNAIALQDDGKFVVVGSSYRDIALSRYNSDGTLDLTFSEDGRVLTQNTCNCNYSLAIQKDKKIIVIGEISGDIGLFRFMENGDPDLSFGEGGKVSTDMHGSYDRGQAVLVQDDGKIIATGQSYPGHYADIPVIRYLENGGLDLTFDGDGKLTTDFSGYNDAAYAIQLQKDGKLVVAGEVSDIQGYDFGIARYNTTGLISVSTEIKIYPNPTFGKITFEGIDLSRLVMEDDIHLYDVLGRMIDGLEMEGNTIDISAKPAGIYFLKFDNHIEKIIKVNF